MHIEKEHELARKVSGRLCFLAMGATTILLGPVWAGQQPAESEPSTNEEPIELPSHMAESIRSDVSKLVIISGERPASEEVTGSYERETPGLIGGMDEGSRIGTISKEIGGVPVNIPIPVIGTLGAIYGGISGAAKREIQEFRDALTKELVSADSPPLRSDGLALDAFWAIRRLPNIESSLFASTTPMPSDTDSVLYVNLNELTIDVQGKEAIITTSADAILRRPGDNRNLYETVVQYQDRDTLSNWTENDNALWRDYTNFARHYLGRAIAADVFDQIELQHELLPVETDTAEQARKNKWKFVSDSLTPTLAWALTVNGDGPDAAWTGTIHESNIFYDIEIFDNRQLVYYEKDVQDPRHTVAFELEPCKTYRWTVRPSFHIDNGVRFGEWMRISSDAEDGPLMRKGIYGRMASEAPAYLQDFAFLEIECQ